MTAAGGPFTWAPRVDEDMIDLFFEEAAERIENISSKLIALEQRGGDRELLGDLFRDLHTVKGSSAMVGLDPVQRLAHAAEDLVGALRDDNRAVDQGAVNASSPRSTPSARCSRRPAEDARSPSIRRRW